MQTLQRIRSYGRQLQYSKKFDASMLKGKPNVGERIHKRFVTEKQQVTEIQLESVEVDELITTTTSKEHSATTQQLLNPTVCSPPVVQVKIRASIESIPALLSSGASSNYISRGQLESLGLLHEIKQAPPREFTDARGNTTFADKAIDLPTVITLGSTDLEVHLICYVVPDLYEEMCLGYPFIYKYQDIFKLKDVEKMRLDEQKESHCESLERAESTRQTNISELRVEVPIETPKVQELQIDTVEAEVAEADQITNAEVSTKAEDVKAEEFTEAIPVIEVNQAANTTVVELDSNHNCSRKLMLVPVPYTDKNLVDVEIPDVAVGKKVNSVIRRSKEVGSVVSPKVRRFNYAELSSALRVLFITMTYLLLMWLTLSFFTGLLSKEMRLSFKSFGLLLLKSATPCFGSTFFLKEHTLIRRLHLLS
ncbi:hypothetical protein CANARDRAFT_178441 [[Candida] arabinofermentans NRRL YB-2248]|uniref:Uncharacterized protein n=1 Tax=[Candida] arabinofermentans NRRL YB-2248 TaxID=983967 RepID=A0A1E4SSL4_9ASCO|nr:hypothetical protein CANARDRAFT_178441 [[Candida] arabinofermentans NRRL YB-2248]